MSICFLPVFYCPVCQMPHPYSLNRSRKALRRHEAAGVEALKPPGDLSSASSVSAWLSHSCTSLEYTYARALCVEREYVCEELPLLHNDSCANCNRSKWTSWTLGWLWICCLKMSVSLSMCQRSNTILVEVRITLIKCITAALRLRPFSYAGFS